MDNILRVPIVGMLVCFRPSDHDDDIPRFPGCGPYPAEIVRVYDRQTPNRLGPFVDLLAYGPYGYKIFASVPNGGGWYSWDFARVEDIRAEWKAWAMNQRRERMTAFYDYLMSDECTRDIGDDLNWKQTQ